MAAQFTDITLEDFDVFLKRAFRSLKPKQAVCKSEYCYYLNLSDNVRIQIQTAISRGASSTREVGSDTIKLMLVGGASNRPLLAGKKVALSMKRTQGWKNTLQNRIEDLVVLYEDRLEYWESRATGTPTVREEIRDDRHLDLDDRDTDLDESQDEPPPRSPPPPPPNAGPLYGTFAKLKNGDWGAKITGKGTPGAKALLTTMSGQKRTVTLSVLQWKGRDNYGQGGDVEIWSIDNTRKTADDSAD